MLGRGLRTSQKFTMQKAPTSISAGLCLRKFTYFSPVLIVLFRPHIVHYVIKMFLGLLGALLLFLAISFVSNPKTSLVQTVLLFIFGFVLLSLAALTSHRPGRRVVIAVTNVISAHLGKKFIMVESDAVIEIERKLSVTDSYSFHCSSLLISSIVTCSAWMLAKLEVLLDPDNLWQLSHRGRWVKKDELKIYYSELNDRGIFFAVFLIIKNVIVGITLADSPSLVGAVQKVSICCILYTLLIIHCYFGLLKSHLFAGLDYCCSIHI